MNEQLAKQIIEMRDIDQELRLKAKPGKELINYVIYTVDGVHNQRVHQLIKKHGFPTKELVGEEALSAFWLLIQHQDYDLDLQEECLKNCDFEKKDFAHLTDRVRVNGGKPQLFGTQFFRDKDGTLKPRPIEDEGGLEKRRVEHGLEPFEEYKKRMLDRNK